MFGNGVFDDRVSLIQKTAQSSSSVCETHNIQEHSRRHYKTTDTQDVEQRSHNAQDVEGRILFTELNREIKAYFSLYF